MSSNYMAPKLTPAEVSKRYKKMSVEFAECVSKIQEIYNSCEYLADKCSDNADPQCDVSAVLEKCASALSSLVIYADEYESLAIKDKETGTETVYN